MIRHVVDFALRERLLIAAMTLLLLIWGVISFIKLPVEANLLDNYVLRHKIYPSTGHYDGHLREFNANSVFYFIRKLGLTPLAEGLYRYHPEDVQSARNLSLSGSVKDVVVRVARALLGAVLHKKLFIAVCGPGGYYCVATFNRGNVLNP